MPWTELSTVGIVGLFSVLLYTIYFTTDRKVKILSVSVYHKTIFWVHKTILHDKVRGILPSILFVSFTPYLLRTFSFESLKFAPKFIYFQSPGEYKICSQFCTECKSVCCIQGVVECITEQVAYKTFRTYGNFTAIWLEYLRKIFILFRISLKS